MNIRMLIFSGIMTALVGGILGLVVNYVGQKESHRWNALVGGAAVGFLIGIGYEAIQQNKNEEADE